MARSPVDLEQMSDGQLRELMQHARELLGRRIHERMDEFRMLAHEAGFEVILTKIGEGTGQRRRRRSSGDGGDDDRRSAVAAKYRNPDNGSETWSGRGRKPKWVEEKLASGATLEEMLVNKGDKAETEEVKASV